MYRFDDVGEIKNYRETVEGFLDLTITFSKVGPLVYQRADGRVETEYLTEEELFNEESLSTATGKPVTYLHPPEGMVDTKNFRQYVRGSTGTRIIKDSPFAVITATVHDAELINIIKMGRAKQVSAGYNVETVKKADGRLYQQNRVYNHFSIVPEGRAGAEVKVHYGDNLFENAPNDDNFLVRVTDSVHCAALQRHKRPLALNKESSQRLSKKHRAMPRVEKLPGHVGPLDHLRRRQP